MACGPNKIPDAQLCQGRTFTGRQIATVFRIFAAFEEPAASFNMQF